MTFYKSNIINLEDQIIVNNKKLGVDMNTDIYYIQIKTYVNESYCFSYELTNIEVKVIGHIVFFNIVPPPFISYIGGEFRIDKPETISERRKIITSFLLGPNSHKYVINN